MPDIRQFPTPASHDVSLATPIVGLPMQVGDAHVVATVRCLCLAANTPQTIRGLDIPAICRECGRVYGITRVYFDRTQGVAPQIEVAVIGFADVKPQSPLLNA